MSFGLDNCPVLEMKEGKKINSTEMELQDYQRICEMEIGGSKYLGILQLDQILNTRMKDKITTEYIRTVNKFV